MTKKVVVISAFPPVKDNYKAPNSLIHNLLKYRPNEFKLYLYYYQQKEIPINVINNDLELLKSAFIKSLPPRKISRRKLFQNKLNIHLSFFNNNSLPIIINQYIPEKETLNEINKINPDYVWLYPYWLYKWKALSFQYNTVVSGMDSAALHYIRALNYGAWKNRNEFFSNVHNYTTYVNLEYKWGELPIRMHMVGNEDLEYYTKINMACSNGFFTLHPHNEFILKNNYFAKSKIDVLITGDAKGIYFGSYFDKIKEELLINVDLANNYSFTLIGSNFEEISRTLSSVGYEVNLKQWVNNFSNEIANSDIQIFPIVIGTGTKNKVLHAMATGLIGIGTNCAFENIKVDPGKDCIIINDPSDIVNILRDIILNKNKYIQIGQRGAMAIRTNHDPIVTADSFWKYFHPI